ncbi:cupin domain-containing protein [bacterium]|nr:cupin domain-containing protein [bacterium]
MASNSNNKEVLLKTRKTWDNTDFSKIDIKNPEVTVLKITIGIGESLPMHKHDILNIAYVKQGTLTVTTDTNEQITVNEGECLPEVISKYHYGKNTGSKPVELIVFYVGEKDTPLAVNKN